MHDLSIFAPAPTKSISLSEYRPTNAVSDHASTPSIFESMRVDRSHRVRTANHAITDPTLNQNFGGFTTVNPAQWTTIRDRNVARIQKAKAYLSSDSWNLPDDRTNSLSLHNPRQYKSLITEGRKSISPHHVKN